MRDNPSVIGGILSYNHEITIEDASKLCGGNEIHCCELPIQEFSSVANSILSVLKSKGCDLIAF